MRAHPRRVRGGCAADARPVQHAAVSTSVAVVLHLAEQALEEGRLAGEAEIVETGIRRIVRDGDELVSFVQANRPPGPVARTTSPPAAT